MRYLNTSEYDSILLAALRESGLTDGAAKRLIQSRWPMDAAGLLCEATGRGLLVDMLHVHQFVMEVTGSDFDYGEDQFEPEIADAFFQWAADSGKARLTPIGEHLQRPDADKRIKARCRVANAVNN